MGNTVLVIFVVKSAIDNLMPVFCAAKCGAIGSLNANGLMVAYGFFIDAACCNAKASALINLPLLSGSQPEAIGLMAKVLRFSALNCRSRETVI